MAELPDDVIGSLVEAASGIDIVLELLARIPEAVEYVDAWRKTLINNGSLREESPTNDFLGVLTVAATWIANGSIAARVRAEALIQLCEALGEPIETPADHPSEPPYRITWDRALDIARGRTAVWSDLLRRAAVADAEWLAEYRGRAGAAVFDPVAEAVAAERQRIVSEFATVARVAHTADGETDAERLLEAARRIGSGYPVRGANTAEAVARLLRFVARFISAAGSVPVATPQPGPIRQHSAECGGPAVCSNLRCRCACHFEGMPPRYDQCYGTCTVDCGHRKGEGPPFPVPAERCPCKACAGPDGGETRCKCDLCIRSAIWRPESTCICQLCEYARGLVKVRHRTV